MNPSTAIPYLRTHSYYGFLESLLSPDDLVQSAKRTGITTLGLTDHRYLTGAIEFYQACLKANIHPILGLEVDFAFEGYQGLLVLLAKNRQGWSNLCRLSSKMLVEQAGIGLEDLQTHREGLICFTGDPRGILRQLILNSSPPRNLPTHFLTQLKENFQEDFFVEVQRFVNGPLKNERQLLDLIKAHKLQPIATQNIFYNSSSDQATYRTLTAIQHITPIQSLAKDQLPPGSAHFPEKEDFHHRYQDLPQALDNLNLISDRCHLQLPIGQTHFPTFNTKNGQTQSDLLKARAFQGAKEKYKPLTPEITERLNYELNMISEMGYEPIFLIVEDILNQARKLGIPTSSRGSAASSLVAHCLDITSPDPIALNLYFERFLNPARKKPPDIDTDIASHRREEVIQYVFDKYGKDRVAMVGTINRYRPKSSLGDAAKAHGLSPDTIRQLTKKVPSSFFFRRGIDDDDPFETLLRNPTIPILKDIIKDARAIMDIPRHLSVHPGGIIIAPFPITDLVPLVHSSSLGINHAQYDLEGIEKFGLVKIDLLGVRGLSVLGEVADRVHSWHISEYNNPLDVLKKVPANDQATSKTVCDARTIGCFQIESPGMRATLQEINAKSIEDIMAALALYRPGPLRGGLRDAFVRRFRGEEPVTHIHESLSKLLENTMGVILYQEQVLQIAHELGGLTLAQADILRRAMSHFDPGGVMETLRKNFIDGAAQRRNVPPETANRIWEMMAAFAGYGFPKAHAASYARLAWNSAWCKTHYPAEFMSAVLGIGGGYYSQRVYLMEARRLGLQVNPPHINHSNHHFRVTYPNGQPVLYMGLNQVRDLTQHTITTIIQKRPFDSLEDFIIRVDPQRKEAKHLVMCGALEGLTSIPQGLNRVEHQRPPGQLGLFSQKSTEEDWPIEQKIKAQQEILGVSLAMSPLEQHADQIQAWGAISTLEAQNKIGDKVRIAGMRQTWRRFRTRSNETMCYLNLEDLEGSLQVVMPPRVYRRYINVLQEPGPFLVEGTMEENAESQRIRLLAHKLELLTS
jgi:DNA-directed DNA polymerase III PolC